ncbi:MAG: enoyl-CoA hydratase-related protein [Actinomycetota bacterium]|jgi:enoyl-CoA hydratase/carnithine racemase|nr:enoyl-CoA hydratase-related protein [Actinomycetota bacterium]
MADHDQEPSDAGTDRVGPFGEAATYERDGHVATITYNRPEALNAVNRDLRRDLNAAWEMFMADEEAWVAILTGAGDRAFCAGADLADGGGSAGDFPGTFWEKPTVNSFESGLEVFKPTIAAVNGHCIGYGLTAVVACDFVLASERATFAWPEVTLGIPTIVGAIRLPRRIAWADAMELLLTGESVDAERAAAMGLVWRISDHDRLMDDALSLADRLCRAAPLAARATKEVAVRTRSMPWTEAVRFGETMRLVAASTDDAAEGRLARSDRRPPEWQGR